MDVKCARHVKRINIYYDDTYYINQDRSFNSIDILLNYYTNHPPRIKRKGRVFSGSLLLKKPLVVPSCVETDHLANETNISDQGQPSYLRKPLYDSELKYSVPIFQKQ